MKRILILLLLVSNLTFGQTTKNYIENINKDFIEYTDLIYEQEFEKSMEYMIPDFFEFIPKNQMIMFMKEVFNDPDLEFQASKPKDIVCEEPKKIENKYYSEINYSYDMKMKFNNIADSEDEEQNEFIRNLTNQQLENTFGSENVKYNEETEFYEIHSIKNALGISENGTSDWKFVVIEPEQKFILEKILPQEITEKIYKN